MQYAKREVSTTRPEHGKFQCEVEVPQFESWEEMCQAVGSVDKALDFLNGAVATGSVNGARAYARNAGADKSNEEIVPLVRSTARQYVPTGGERGPTKKEKLANFDTAMALLAKVRAGTELSEAEEEQLEALADKFGA